MMNLRRLLAVSIATLFLGFAPGARAQEERRAIPTDEFEREKYFALTLVDWGLPDYAQIAKDGLAAKFPAQKDGLLLIQANIFFRQKKYDAVEELLKQIPANNAKASAVRLRMAAYLMAEGDRKKAGEIIQAFFDQIKDEVPQDPDLKEQYISAVFILADIYKSGGEPAKAVGILGKISKAGPSKVLQRKADSDRAYAMLDVAVGQAGDERNKTLAEVEKIANALQWVSDPYKGHGLVAIATAKKLRGDKAGAIKFLQEYAADLKAIDDAMREQGVEIDNPLAAARLFTGQCHEEDGHALLKSGKKDEAKKAFGAALTEYLNTFRKYGKDDAGKRAGLLYSELGALVKKEFNVDVAPVSNSTAANPNPSTDTRIAMTMLNLADELRKNGKLPEAIAGYVDLLNKFPETPLTGQILRSLVSCYEKTGDDLLVEMVSLYACERFTEREDVVAIGHSAAISFIKAGKIEPATNIIARILVASPTYKHNCGLRYTLAQYLSKADQTTAAIAEFQKVVDTCGGDAVALKALTALSAIAYTAGRYDVAATNLTRLVETAPEGIEKADAKTRLANCHMQLKQMDKALELLRGLIADLQPGKPNSPYYTPDLKAKSEGLLQTNTFFYAATLANLAPDTAGVKDPVGEALKVYDEFIAKNASNKSMTPKAMYARGRLLIQQDKFEDAIQSFEQLAAKFPDSEEGQGAMFAGVKAAIEAKKPEVARQFVQKMLGNRGAYGAREFLIVGNFMSSSGMFEEAEKCLQSVVDHPDTAKDETLHQRALYGFALSANRQAAANNNDAKRIEAAIKSINTLTNKYAKTGLLMDAALLQASNHRLKKDYSAAIISLNLVFENAHRIGDQRAELLANVELARIQTDRGEVLPAFGSMVRIVLTARFKDEKLRPYYRDVLLQGLDAGGKLPQSRPQDLKTLCDRFLDNYPGDPETERIQAIRKKAIVELGTSS